MKTIEILYSKAIEYLTKADYEKANKLLKFYLTKKPNSADALNNLGVSFFQLKKYDVAANCFKRAQQLSPLNNESINNLGMAYLKIGNIQSAINQFERAISLNPRYLSPLLNLSLCHKELKDYSKAITYIRKALSLQENNTEALSNYGMILYLMRDFQSAEKVFHDITKQVPNSFEAKKNYGYLKQELGDFTGALALFNEALGLHPGDKPTLFNKSLVLLTKGMYSEGIKLYENRFASGSVTTRFNPYRTELLLGDISERSGKFLIYHEQGLGDLIQSFRFVKLLSRLGFEVYLEAPESLRGIFRRSCPSVQFVQNVTSVEGYKHVCPIMSLSYFFNLERECIPLTSGYLTSDKIKNADWRKEIRNKKKFRLGICWSSVSSFPGDYKRSMHLKLFKRIFHGFDLDIIVLQKIIKPGDLNAFKKLVGVSFFGSKLSTFDDTASLATSCDLIITTCTSIPHLTGALGIKTLLLVSKSPDWRWGESGSGTDWYKSINVIRQDVFGEWGPVVKRTRRLLKKEIYKSRAL
jgi:Tfp pilus assembly protein PilF